MDAARPKFQFTPACAGDRTCDRRLSCHACFNSRPRVRATSTGTDSPITFGCFNSRPRVRATLSVCVVTRCRCFNSRPRVRATGCGLAATHNLSVSIHARVCGRHVAGAHSMHIWRFNSRPRVRATHRGSEERKIHPLFQFTPACAGDDPPRRCVGRGASFNSRPRVRATTPDFVLVYFGACFNSRPRVRATMRLCNGNEVYRVSIHARVCGRLPARRRARVDGKVSIHARVCGRQRQQT